MTRQISGAALFPLGLMVISNSALNGLAFLVRIVKHSMAVSSHLTALRRQTTMMAVILILGQVGAFPRHLQAAVVAPTPVKSPALNLEDAFPVRCHR